MIEGDCVLGDALPASSFKMDDSDEGERAWQGLPLSFPRDYCEAFSRSLGRSVMKVQHVCAGATEGRAIPPTRGMELTCGQ